MLTHLKLEIFKLTRRGRSYIGFGALLVMAGLVVLALKNGPSPFDQSFSGQFMSVGTYLNGGFVAWFLLRIAMVLFLPLFACVVTGDMISGEASDGTLRATLSKPIRRGNLFVSKFLVAVLYLVVLTYLMGLAAYVLGAIFLGRGSLATYTTGTMLGAQGVYVFGESDGIVRLLGAYGFATIAVLSVATIAFFLSSIVMNSLAAIGGAMVTMIVFQIMGVIPYFDRIKPYLFTTYFDSWAWLFVTPVPWHEVEKSLAVLGSYTAVFFIAGLIIFKRKDILS